MTPDVEKLFVFMRGSRYLCVNNLRYIYIVLNMELDHWIRCHSGDTTLIVFVAGHF